MKYTSKHNLEFHGIHEEQDEKMCERLKRKNSSRRHWHLPQDSSQPAICAQTSTRMLQVLLVKWARYSACRQLRHIDISQIFWDTILVYINDNLTKSLRQLFGKTRKAKDDEKSMEKYFLKDPCMSSLFVSLKLKTKTLLNNFLTIPTNTCNRSLNVCKKKTL